MGPRVAASTKPDAAVDDAGTPRKIFTAVFKDVFFAQASLFQRPISASCVQRDIATIQPLIEVEVLRSIEMTF